MPATPIAKVGNGYGGTRRKIMPAVSQKQQIAMNLAKAVQKGEASAKPGSPSAQIAQSMKPSDLTDFVGPVDKSLPKRVPAPVPSGPAMAPPAAPPGLPMQNVGGPGPGRPGINVKNVGKPIKKMRIG
jgi:hypothetical protein